MASVIGSLIEAVAGGVGAGRILSEVPVPEFVLSYIEAVAGNENDDAVGYTVYEKDIKDAWAEIKGKRADGLVREVVDAAADKGWVSAEPDHEGRMEVTLLEKGYKALQRARQNKTFASMFESVAGVVAAMQESADRQYMKGRQTAQVMSNERNE